jgi:isocitrate dehydrogenase (NAD+)
MLLDHIGRYDVGHELRLALLASIAEGECTKDIGGKLGAREFTRTVIDRLRDKF